MIKGKFKIEFEVDSEIYDDTFDEGVDVVYDRASSLKEILEDFTQCNDGVEFKSIKLKVSKL